MKHPCILYTKGNENQGKGALLGKGACPLVNLSLVTCHLLTYLRMKKTVCTIWMAMIVAVPLSLAQNPFVRDIYTADPSAHVWSDGRLYVYPSHDMDPPRGCDLMDKYHVYSTGDMVNWTDHGQILEASDVPWGTPLENGGKFMWAPDCAYKNGKYYFYFPHPDKDPWNSNWKIGIAVSDYPASGFTILPQPLLGLPDNGMIDPCVFIDDDGQAYFYYGGGNHCQGAKLKDNMIELDGELQAMTGLTDFHEGTWVFKRDGVYYLTYADNNSGANQLRHATSNNPLGPWSYKGVYLRPTTSDTSHGSVVEYKGQWWAFYHTADISGTGLLRSICVDSLFFNENGTIRTVVQTKDQGSPYPDVWKTLPCTIEAEDYNAGGKGIAYWDNTTGNQYGEYRNGDVDINRNRRYGVFYVVTENNEYINYSFEVLQDDIYTIDFIISSGASGKEEKFYLEFDYQRTSNPRRYTVTYSDISDLGVVSVPNIELKKGRHTMTFRPMGTLHFDKFSFVGTTAIQPLEPALDGVAVATVSDISGKLILECEINSGNPVVNLSGQAPGVYILSLKTNNRVSRSKLIKQ
jgi:hypothetical protein